MSTHGKTRLACRIVRLRDAMTGTRPAGHVAHCADCQAYFNTDALLVGQLRAAAPCHAQPVPDELAARIARAVRQSTPVRAPRRSRAFETFAVLAGAAAAFAFAFHLVRQNVVKPSGGPTTEIVETAKPADIAAFVAGVGSLRARLIDSVEPTAETLAEQNPLTREIASVQADARTALGFLALNFLPSDSARLLETRIDPAGS